MQDHFLDSRKTDWDKHIFWPQSFSERVPLNYEEPVTLKWEGEMLMWLLCRDKNLVQWHFRKSFWQSFENNNVWLKASAWLWPRSWKALHLILNGINAEDKLSSWQKEEEERCEVCWQWGREVQSCAAVSPSAGWGRVCAPAPSSPWPSRWPADPAAQSKEVMRRGKEDCETQTHWQTRTNVLCWYELFSSPVYHLTNTLLWSTHDKNTSAVCLFAKDVNVSKWPERVNSPQTEDFSAEEMSRLTLRCIL